MKRLYLLLFIIIAAAALSACDDNGTILSTESVLDESAVIDIVIDSVSPAEVEIGKQVTVNGTGFNLSKDKVLIGNIEIAPDGAEGAEDKNDGAEIVFTVPAQAPVGDAELKVKRNDEIESNVVDIKIAPAVNHDEAKAPPDTDPEQDADDEAQDDTKGDDTAEDDDSAPIGHLTFTINESRNRKMAIFMKILKTLREKGFDPASLTSE